LRASQFVTLFVMQETSGENTGAAGRRNIITLLRPWIIRTIGAAAGFPDCNWTLTK